MTQSGLALPQAGRGPEEAGQQIPTAAQPPQHWEEKTPERARTLGDPTKTGEPAERLYVSSRAKQSLVWNFSQAVTFF